MDTLKDALALAQYEVMRANEKLELIETLIAAKQDGQDVIEAMQKQMQQMQGKKEAGDEEEGGKKKKRKHAPKFDEDGNQIKRPMSGYQLYIKSTLNKDDEEHANFTKCAALWKSLDEDTKTDWNEKAKLLPTVIISPETPNEKVVEKETAKDDDASAEPVVTSEKKKKKKEKKEKKEKKARKESMGSQSTDNDFEK